MTVSRVWALRVHRKALLTCREFDNRLDFTLENKETGKRATKSYYKLSARINASEALKIDTIIYHMHSEIELDLWKEY